MESVILKKEKVKIDKVVYHVYTTKKIHRGKRLLGDFKIFIRDNGIYLGDVYLFNLKKRIAYERSGGKSYECEFIKNSEHGKFYCLPGSEESIRFLFKKKMYDNLAVFMYDILNSAEIRGPMFYTSAFFSEAKCKDISKLSNRKIFKRTYVVQKND